MTDRPEDASDFTPEPHAQPDEEAISPLQWIREELHPDETVERSLSAEVLISLKYIHSNFRGDIGVQEMADTAGLSACHFIRRFKQDTGLTPYRYLILLRIRHAQRLLVERPGLRSKEVGGLVGYNDATAFTRLFKDHVGVTPLGYRRRKLNRMLGKAGEGSGGQEDSD
jgi:transcriptional regulator GlxA family with amidase domain